MSDLQKEIMHKLHGHDVWRDLDLVLSPPSSPQGWHGDHPSLSRLASSSACVVDVGVWKGDSTITLAQTIKRNKINGCVIAVDTFLGSPEHYLNVEFSNMFERSNGRPLLYEVFLSNIVHAGVQDIVVPLPQTSITAAAILKGCSIHPDLVHIDAAHEYADVVRDADAYWDILSPGGFLIGDDYTAFWSGVVRAAGEFSAKHVAPLEIEHPKWIVRKKNS